MTKRHWWMAFSMISMIISIISMMVQGPQVQEDVGFSDIGEQVSGLMSDPDAGQMMKIMGGSDPDEDFLTTPE